MPFSVTSRALALLLEGHITPDSPRHSQFLAWWCMDSPYYSQPFLAGSWSIQTAPEGAVLLPAPPSLPGLSGLWSISMFCWCSWINSTSIHIGTEGSLMGVKDVGVVEECDKLSCRICTMERSQVCMQFVSLLPLFLIFILLLFSMCWWAWRNQFVSCYCYGSILILYSHRVYCRLSISILTEVQTFCLSQSSHISYPSCMYQPVTYTLW